MKRAVVVLMLLAFVAGASFATPIIIDPFDEGYLWQPAITTSFSDTASVSNVLGGVRHIEIENAASTGYMALTINNPTVGAAGILDIQSGTNAIPNVRLLYGNVDTNQLNLDLSNFLAFVFTTDYRDHPGGALIVNLYTKDGGVSTNSIPELAAGSSQYQIPIAGFTGTADLSDVDAIEIVLRGVPNLDMSFDTIELTDTPEPGTLMLVGMALVGFGVGYRRFRGRNA
ncbi:MAG: PEP-CTERM sorting domain-containing protein [bacterium]